MKKILAIIPAYNEEMNIGKVISEIRNSIDDISIVVINDNSKDNTANVAREAGANVINLACNLGYGGAIQTGFKYAVAEGYDYGVLIDGDGQHDPRCIRDLLSVVQSGEADITIGSRFLGDLQYTVPLARRIGMAIFGKIASIVIRQKVSDPTSGYQAMNRRVMLSFANDNYPSDYPDADTIILLNFLGFKIKEVPVVMRNRIAGSSMHSKLKSLYYIYKMFLAIFIILLRRGQIRREAISNGH
ncbi:glycosyltransferase family 2 protein [candidate division KSB1 bacterium]|nr:glycosyltransferase family 2 protein [candidate division KSB1 bacterium]